VHALLIFGINGKESSLIPTENQGGKDVPTFQVGIRENLFTVNKNLIYELKCSGGGDIIGESQFIYLFDG